ncbi:lipopolysaccharide biosynthesis protein [Pontibacter burrus]|uniref:Oligosaccharide flippase family protein n=1 Tax=Pontibacter burrus TaxID=2704466 RepID=A0A6B3LNZ4_9BACT|nr:oligosaccharide flippase family protein [Pontibacter burrus]NEM97603.1 oligosaccharide flippase family protein [Pontibacter burrus]
MKKNFSLVLISNIVVALSKWIIVVVLAKTVGANLVGIYTFSLAVVSPIFMLTNLALRNLLVADVYENYNFSDYFTLRVLFSLIGFISSVSIGYYIRDGEYFTIILVMSSSKIIESLIDIFNGYQQKKGEFNIIAKCLIYRSIIGVLLFALTLFITHNIIIALLLQVFSDIVVFLLIEVKHYLSENESKTLIPNLTYNNISLIKAAVPIASVSLLGTLNINIPRYILEAKLGLYELGIYSGIIYFTVAGNTIISALGQASIGKFSNLLKKNESLKYKYLLYKLTFVVFTIGLVGIAISYIAGEDILRIAYSEDFAQYKDLFILVMVNGLIMYIASFLGFLQITAKDLHVMYLKVYVCTIAINTFLSYYFISQYSIAGAIYSSIISFLFLSFLSFYILMKRVNTIHNIFIRVQDV